MGGTMFLLVARAYLKLIRFEIYLARTDFAGLYKGVKNYAPGSHPSKPQPVDLVCRAVDIACVCYWKRVLCLQRSAVTACLLKRFGIPAHMIIGTQQMPLRSHAWVEVEGRVVSDKPYMRELYQVLAEC
jgi:Transglutaminase-like superfamily